YFSCSDNKLTSLEGVPKRVGSGFLCYNSNLTSLKGAPKKVGRDFYCVILVLSVGKSDITLP
ncbi:MAG: hypothetical protein QQN63_12750, partial [Nitrosopumilus sp.]